jgi:hypothetical protein
MNVILWAIQILLAIVFLVSGIAKAFRPGEKLRAELPEFHPGVIRLIAVAEIVGALGLVLPGVTGIDPILTPAAATGLAIVMVGAVTTHGRRRQGKAVAMNVVLLVIAVVVAVGRFGPFPL